MEHNVGTIDRALRAVVGVVLLAVFFLVPPANVYLYYGALVVGVVMLGTSILSVCPAYSILGIKTCAIKSTED